MFPFRGEGDQGFLEAEGLFSVGFLPFGLSSEEERESVWGGAKEVECSKAFIPAVDVVVFREAMSLFLIFFSLFLFNMHIHTIAHTHTHITYPHRDTQ